MTLPHTLSLLEFDKLLRIISGFTNSSASETGVAQLLPLSDSREIEQRQGRIGDILRMSSEGVSLGLSPFPDIGALLSKIRPEGAVLEAAELAGFVPVLDLIAEVSARLGERDDIPVLRQLTDNLAGFPDLLKVLKKSVDSQGNILDTASFELAGIRREMQRLEARIRRKLEDMTHSESVAVFLQDDFVTTRSGRWVIPVRMDSKGQVAGVVHDVSKSGETAFVEPIAIIGLSNELENLTAEEKAEQIRILKRISAMIREVLEEIGSQFGTLVSLDVLNSIAAFAVSLNMKLPSLNSAGIIELINARHPLLSLAFQKQGPARTVVPLTVRLGGENNVMVITGSNAGGKTISIKTIGLLTLMALTGMPVPADPSSNFPLIDDILIDIGDEQSIENDLSTFSAHIAHISNILKKATSKSLVLLDELGTGTDPAEGAALSCAVLNELKGKGALLFATTHLMDIKGFVHRTSGMMNASMEFDQNTLTPLYLLRIGEPGQSHAIEIARRYGLPDSVVDSAKALLGGVKVEFDNLIRDLTEKRAYYESSIKEIERQKAQLEENRRVLDKLAADTKRERDEMMSKTYREASDITTAIKRELYELLEAAKKADKEKIRESIRAAEEKKKELEKAVGPYRLAEGESLSPELVQKGDMVFVNSIGADAEVVDTDKRHDRVRVRYGSIEVEIPFSGIQKKRGKTAAGKRSLKQEMPMSTPEESAASSINIVGKRVDDALSEIEPFLNHSSLAGYREIIIIHGIGAGILARAVREHLTRHPLVQGFRGGGPNEGGAGVTVVTLK